MYASLNGNFEIAKLLIENNADMNIQNKVFFFLINKDLFISSLHLTYYISN
jgi:ankyrin repeat protein